MPNSISSVYILLAFLVAIIMLLITSFRYKLILKNLNCKITLFHSLIVLCVTQLTNYLAPFKAGVLIAKPTLTKKLSDADLKKSFIAVFYEQFYEISWQILLLPILLLCIGEILLFNQAITKAILAIIVIIALIIILINKKKLIKIIWKFKYFIPKKLKEKAKQQNISEDSTHKIVDEMSRFILNRRFFFRILLPTLFIILIGPLMIQFTALSFSIFINYKHAFLIYWTSMIIGRLSGLPGGFGSRDLTMVALLKGINISSILVVQIVLLYRIITILPVVIIGLPSLIYYGKDIKIRKFFKQK